MSGNYLDSVIFDALEVDPEAPVEGQRWFNGTDRKHKKYRNSHTEVDVAVVGVPADGQHIAWDNANGNWVPATPLTLTPSAPAGVTKAAAVVGSATVAAKSDHKHDVSTAAPSLGVGAGNTEGSATSLARSDHNHKLRESGGPTDLTLGAINDGEFLKRVGTAITSVAIAGSGVQVTLVTDVNTSTTNSTNYTLLDSMTVTPGAGSYKIHFTGSFGGTSVINLCIYVNGALRTHTVRTRDVFKSSDIDEMSTHDFVTVTAGQAIEIRWKVGNGTGSGYQKTLTLEKI
jgi:hypothetical protein